jgi:hypothetical protein
MIKSILDSYGPTASLICQGEKRRTNTGRLPKLLSDAILFQWLAARETGSKANLKMDVMRGVSEVTLTKDIIDHSTQNRFRNEILPDLEVTIMEEEKMPATSY